MAVSKSTCNLIIKLCNSKIESLAQFSDTPLVCTMELDCCGINVSTNMLDVCRVVGMGSKLIACGSVVLEFEISNDDLAKIVETSDEWISIRTGIRKRRVLIGRLFLQ